MSPAMIALLSFAIPPPPPPNLLSALAEPRPSTGRMRSRFLPAPLLLPSSGGRKLGVDLVLIQEPRGEKEETGVVGSVYKLYIARVSAR